MIREYTREAGVRNLERRIADLLPQGRARGRRGQDREDRRSTTTQAREWLGPRRFPADSRKRTADPASRPGSPYTPVGGDVLFIEATAYPGNGQAHDHRPARRRDAGVRAGRALVGALAHRASSALPENWFAEHDVHIHVPAGAVPKDGPSAGRHDGDRDRLARARRAGRRRRRR